MQALLGTRLSADINLVAQVLILAGLFVGFYFARRKRFGNHANMQTTMVLGNLFFIAFFMIGSLYNYVIAGGTTTGAVARLMMVHGILGLLAETSGIYLILRMRTNLIPERLRVRNYKLVMRSTLALWTLLVVLGVGVYYYRYLAPKPSVTTYALPQLNRASEDLVMHALELRDAAKRANLETAKRHAEHLVNLIEGRNGAHYGDGDKSGVVEDPGDGTGLLGYLQAAPNAPGGAALSSFAQRTRDASLRIADSAVKVLAASDLKSAEALGEELLTRANRAAAPSISDMERKAKELGVRLAPSLTKPTPQVSEPPNTLTVSITMFQFVVSSVTVKRGTTVVWGSKDQPKHTVNGDDDSFRSGDLGLNDTFSHTFDSPGTFAYYCRFHGDKKGVDMAGTVIVQ
jgi:plastocyanin/uncharacterized membrane protein YozB (DUF420 family)